MQFISFKSRPFALLALAGCAAFLASGARAEETVLTSSPAESTSAPVPPKENIDNVFISLTRTAIDEEKLPTNASVVRTEEIQRRGIQNAGQAVDFVEGVYVQKTAGYGSVHAPKIRGFLNKQIVVFVDNRRIPRDITGNVDLSQIPAEAIDRIEIVRGAGSVLYGPDAEGGVIHIITKQAKGYLPTMRASALAGSYGTEIYQGEVGTKKDRVEGYMTASRNKSDNFQRNNTFDNTSFNGNLGYDFGLFGKTKAYFSHAQSRVGLPGGTTMQVIEWDGEQERNPRSQFSKQEDRQDSFELEHVVDVMQKATLTARGASTELLRDQLSSSTGPVTTRTRVNRKSLYFQADSFFGLTGGFEYYRDDIRSPFSALPQTNGYGVFLQQALTWRSLTAIAGVRFDNNTEWGDTTNPRLSLVYQANDWLKLSGNVGSAYQAPTFADLTDFDSSFQPVTRLSTAPALSPETSWQYDAGVEVSPWDFLSARVTAYRADIRDRITAGFSPDGTRFTTVNVGKAFNQGIEAELDHSIGRRFSHSINYTYLQSEAKGENFSPEFIEISFVPRNRVNYTAWLFLPYRIEFGNTLKYVGEQWTGNNRSGMKMPDYLVWNMQLGWTFREIRLQMGVNNVAERRYAENAGFGVYFPQPGRTYWGSVTVAFL